MRVVRFLLTVVLPVVTVGATMLLMGACATREVRGAVVRDMKALLASPIEVPVEMEAMERHALPGGGVSFSRGRCWRCSTVHKTPLRVVFDWTTCNDVLRGQVSAAHELGHVLGLDHGEEPLAWMFWSDWPGRPFVDHPSARELAQAEKCGDTIDLVLRPDVPLSMEREIEWAAVRWNLYLRRPAFTVRR